MSFFSRFSRKASPTRLEMRFHKDANYHGEHGQLLASHVKQAIDKKPVRFVFLGASQAPILDQALFNHIWEEARAQGYIPHALVSYGDEVSVIKSDLALNVTVQAERFVERPGPKPLDLKEADKHVVLTTSSRLARKHMSPLQELFVPFDMHMDATRWPVHADRPLANSRSETLAMILGHFDRLEAFDNTLRQSVLKNRLSLDAWVAYSMHTAYEGLEDPERSPDLQDEFRQPDSRDLNALLVPRKPTDPRSFPDNVRNQEPENRREVAIGRIYIAFYQGAEYTHPMHCDVGNHGITMQDLDDYAAKMRNNHEHEVPYRMPSSGKTVTEERASIKEQAMRILDLGGQFDVALLDQIDRFGLKNSEIDVVRLAAKTA